MPKRVTLNRDILLVSSDADNQIRCAGAKALAAVLEVNKTVTELMVGGVMFSLYSST